MPAKPLPIRDGEGREISPRPEPGYYPEFSTMSQRGYWDKATRDLVERRVEKNNTAKQQPLKFFNEAQATTMRAVVARMVPQEDRTEDRRIDILSGIDERLASGRIDGYRYDDMPPDGDAYKIAIESIEEMAQSEHGKAFSELEVIEQETLLQQVHDKEPKAAQELWSKMNIGRFWTMLLTDCCAVYYGHPWAWDEVGFGGPSYPRGYMRLEEGEPEPWEVNEQRYEWQPPADTLSGKPQKKNEGAGQ